jgi:hypothetical protein
MKKIKNKEGNYQEIYALLKKEKYKELKWHNFFKEHKLT